MNLSFADVRLTPILVADPPLLNTQGVHQPYTPRLIVEVETADGVVGVGETYGDTKYLELARPFAAKLMPGIANAPFVASRLSAARRPG